MRTKLFLSCLVNVHVHMSGGPHFHRREGPQNPVKLGTQGSLKYYENRDPGPHFPMKMGTRGPQFRGSPLSYDTGNRGRLESRSSDFSNVQIFDYTLGEIFAITGDSQCLAFAIRNDPSSLFGIEKRNGTRHIGSARVFLEGLGEGVVTRYVGEDVVRGIRVQHWQACS